jgi:hypothetical protein
MKTCVRILLIMIGCLLSAADSYGAAPCIKHDFVSGVADSGDPAVVRPVDWNACHEIDDGAVGANKLASAVNAQTGTSYTVLDTDRGKLVTLTNASPVAVSLPQAGAGSAFIDGWFADFQNRGAGTVTITPVTSTIDGGASVALLQNQGLRVFSNGSNYFTQRGLSGSDGLGTAAVVTALTADASPTGDDLVYTVNDPGGTPAQRKATISNLLNTPPTVLTVATLPAVGTVGRTRWISDGSSFECQTGAGSTVVLCYDDGSNWLPLAMSTATTPTLDEAFNQGKIIDGANSLANAVRIGDGTNQFCIYRDSSLGLLSVPCTPASVRQWIQTNQTGGWYDEEGGADIVVVDPDALSAGSGTITVQTGHQVRASNLGVFFTESDTNPTCNTAGQHGFYADTSESKLKWCNDGVPSDIGTGSATISSLHTFRPQQNEPPAANFATLDTRNGHPVLEFDSSTQEAAVFSDVMNRGYSGGNIVVNVWFMCDTNTTAGEEVVWEGAWEKMNTLDLDGDSFDTAIEASPATCSTTAGIMTMATITFTSSQIDGLTAGDPFRFKLLRDPANGGDDLDTLDAQVRLIEIKQ